MKTATFLLAITVSLCGAPKSQIFSLAYSPDGGLLALGGYKDVVLLDAGTRKPLATLTGHAETVRSLSFSRDGKLLAAAGGVAGRKGEVKVWDVGTRAAVATVTGHS